MNEYSSNEHVNKEVHKISLYVRNIIPHMHFVSINALQFDFAYLGSVPFFLQLKLYFTQQMQSNSVNITLALVLFCVFQTVNANDCPKDMPVRFKLRYSTRNGEMKMTMVPPNADPFNALAGSNSRFVYDDQFSFKLNGKFVFCHCTCSVKIERLISSLYANVQRDFAVKFVKYNI